MKHLEPYTLAVQRQRLAKRHWRVLVNGNTVAVIRGVGAKHRAKAIARGFAEMPGAAPPYAPRAAETLRTIAG